MLHGSRSNLCPIDVIQWHHHFAPPTVDYRKSLADVAADIIPHFSFGWSFLRSLKFLSELLKFEANAQADDL